MQIRQVEPLLALIRAAEANGDYEIVWSGISAGNRPPRPLTRMTVGEVLDWQDSIDALYMSEAAGAYQIMEDTLRGLYRQAGVPLSSLFDAPTQDRLALVLLKRRGLDDFLSGRLTAEKFANNLALEWAALPMATGKSAGKSAYGDDGRNKALVTVEAVLDALRIVKAAARPDPEPRTSPLQSTTQRAAGAAHVGNALTAFQVVPQLEGTTQLIAVIGFVVIALALLWIMRERALKWAQGAR